MRSTSTLHNESLGHRLRDRLRWGRKRPSSSTVGKAVSEARPAHTYTTVDSSAAPNGPDSLQVNNVNASLESSSGQQEGSLTPSDSRLTHSTDINSVSTDQTDVASNTEDKDNSQDLWSTAFQEALVSLGEDIDAAIFKGKGIEQIFKQLEEKGKDATQDSLFVRGVKYLRSIQVPLEKFKLALDVTSPLAGIDPTAKIVFGVVTGVTAIAISFASADLDFAKQIGEMLNQLSYIDECDTLGQQTDKQSIHQALVSVYKKILEFYKTAYEILSRKGVKLVLKMALENNRLPEIVEEFLKQAELLHKLVQNATAEIVQDIKLMLYDQEIARWLGSDKTERQSQYHAALCDLKADHACQFLLEEPNLMDWYRTSASSQLVVLGDMGTGKSVAAAFIVDELLQRSKFRVPRPLVCYHYCRDDETGRITYILSVLVLSLLEQLPGLKKTFHGWYKENQVSGNLGPVQDARKLSGFLKDMLGSIERPLFIIIDGLDECDRASRTDLLELLRHSATLNSGMKFLLLSRRNEEVLDRLDEKSRIDLIPDPKRDRVIATHIVQKQLKYLSPDVQLLVIDHLSSTAKGSAIWTKMVVKLLEDRQIRALGPMTRFMKALPLPSQLSDLFETLFLRYTKEDAENQHLARAALKILAASSRPLYIPELAWAAALATAPPDIGTVSEISEFVDQTRILQLIAPFIALDDFDDMYQGKVRLLHQSVKEYILQNMAPESSDPPNVPDRKANGATDAEQKMKILDAYMLSLCIRYLLLDDIDQIELFSEQQLAIDELPEEVDLFGDDQEATEYNISCSWDEWEKNMIRYDPTERGFGGFFVYASCYWVDYFRTVDKESLPDLQNIEALCAACSTRLHNWTQQNCRPGCVVKARFEFDSRQYDPLGVTSLYGSDAMLHHMVNNSDFSTSVFLPETASAAAEQILRWGDLSRLRILALGERAKLPLRIVEFWWLILDSWRNSDRDHRNWDVVFPIVDHMVGTLIEDNCANEILCMAATVGCLPLIERLMTLAQNNEAFSAVLFKIRLEQQSRRISKSSHQSIGEAVLGNHLETVKLLLEQESLNAHLNYVNPHGENVLHLASVHCNPTVFSLLLPHLRERKNQVDGRGDTTLVRIVRSSATLQDRITSAQAVIQANCSNDDGHSSDEQQNPLCVAVQLGDLEMCSFLIRDGAIDPMSALSRASNGQISLRHETTENLGNRLDILQLLSAGVADPKASDKDEKVLP